MRRDLNTPHFSREFVTRRLQSIAGFAFLLFLFEHLLTNSQAALFFGDDGKGFVTSVNFIHSLPYLPVIELSLIALPAVMHAWFGIERILTAKMNHTSLPYSRNRAYSWQRITSWFLLVAILLHVGYMRFIKLPAEISHEKYQVTLTTDPGLASVAKRLNIELQETQAGEVLATTDNIGTAFLAVIRDTFKSPWLCIAYSVFVLVAAYHACNGLWTFCITWGVTLSEPSRVWIRYFSNALMLLLSFFGLVCIWGVYWINLRS